MEYLINGQKIMNIVIWSENINNKIPKIFELS